MNAGSVPTAEGGMRRRLGVSDAVVIGLGSMIGAGIFAALGPAAGAAGSGLLPALALAAVVAYCNATSSARLAARYPQSGGTYVYGRERLGAFWGYLAGWAFVVGKTASCAAMALTVGAYLWPGQAHAVAVAAVAALTAVNYAGVQKSALLTRVIVAVVLAVLAAVAVTALTSAGADTARLDIGPDATVTGVLQAAGLLFFAFAGYARIATLGEEVRDPARTIPRAIPIALGITLAVYSLIAVAALTVLGPAGLADAAAPLTDTVRASGASRLVPVVRVGGAVAALGSLLALILGVSRTTLAMARDRYLPHALATVHPRFGVPHRAELTVGAIVALLAATTDVRGAIGFSSFGVLAYYAIANASAWSLTEEEGRPNRLIPVIGLAGCAALAFALPLSTVVSGTAVLVLGAALYGLRKLSTGNAGH
ncbi:APC family permease [Streptomyces sp. NBC_00053]|uniref:APC family permease n=1 Tax=unclassified Streptomyces TaxID=2593676 RepID=UPI00225524BF|nr:MULTISPECIES: APC family permease [unclassified Streptomyces]WSG55325.1 APC family permease [Streptomyces sp. NBC_01732]WSX06460.1 APC family permease [Streptomyces sp. NBC_00987]MCX5103323.1 APC family permease [Streptomyces sp. NBC_00439]MCX5505255.1 APC family permease [Streptomyces sp. NBC_00052]MCX5546208.1 APC family permease [Streptomyces sp. NBC_00051]